MLSKTRPSFRAGAWVGAIIRRSKAPAMDKMRRMRAPFLKAKRKFRRPPGTTAKRQWRFHPHRGTAAALAPGTLHRRREAVASDVDRAGLQGAVRLFHRI